MMKLKIIQGQGVRNFALLKKRKAECHSALHDHRPNKKVVMQGQATQIIHAYKQAPWRIQRQWIGAFLLIVIGGAMIAALYLDVTARAAVAGREIQELRSEIMTIQRENADLETQLADLTSTAIMRERALALGYRPVKPGELDYVAVPGFFKPEPDILLAAEDTTPRVETQPAEYTQSLLEWLEEQIRSGGMR
jgi:cell division protein FtsL